MSRKGKQTDGDQLIDRLRRKYSPVKAAGFEIYYSLMCRWERGERINAVEYSLEQGCHLNTALARFEDMSRLLPLIRTIDGDWAYVQFVTEDEILDETTVKKRGRKPGQKNKPKEPSLN